MDQRWSNFHSRVSMIWETFLKKKTFANKLEIPNESTCRKGLALYLWTEIYFSIDTTKFLFKYTLLCFQMYRRHMILLTKHNYKVSASFMVESPVPLPNCVRCLMSRLYSSSDVIFSDYSRSPMRVNYMFWRTCSSVKVRLHATRFIDAI